MFHVPHRPEPVTICAFTVKQRLSPNLNTRLSKRIWAVLSASSCLRARFHCAGENNECATVLLGGFHLLAPPPPPPWLHTYVTYLTGTFAARSLFFLWSSPSSLALSVRITCARDWLYFCLLAAGLAGWGEGRILLHHHRGFSLTFVRSRSRLGCWWGKRCPAWSPFSSRLPGSFYRFGAACVQPRSMIISTVPLTHRRALASSGDALTTPSAAGYYANIPSLSSLPSSLPPIQQLPAGLIHTESPEYCWPGGRAASPETVDGWIGNLVDTVSSPWQPKVQKGHGLSVC